MEIDVILADIIATDMAIDADRVVVYDQNWKSPKDQDIYITIALSSPVRIIGANNNFDPDTDSEIKTVSKSEPYNIEITSKNRDAQDRWPEIIMALGSTYAVQKMEENNIRIFPQSRNVMDLSLIEASSSLHRYRIPVIVNSVTRKVTAITPIESFPVPEVANEPS